MSVRGGRLVAALATVVYVVMVARQLDRPLMYDDANFALAARAVAETGLPFGNQGWMSERGDFSQREQWALWHPPLYVYAEGLATRLGGWTPPVLRGLGIVGGVATAALTYRLAADLTRGPSSLRDAAGGLAVVVLMLSPIVVQSSLIVDIDFPLLLPLTLLFVVLYLRLESRLRAWLWLVPLFAVLLWTKMTNPLPLVGVILVWQVIRAQPRRALLHSLAIGLGGVVLFSLTWLALGRALNFPLDMPLSVNLVEARDSADVARRAYTSVGAFIDGLQSTVLWLGPGLVVLGLVGISVRAGQLARCWRIARADFLIGMLIIFVLGYVNKTAGWFPKYQVALAPLLACLAAPLLARAWCARPRLAAGVGIVGGLAAAAITLRLIRDDWALQRTWAIEPTAAAWLLGVVGLGVLAGLPWRMAAASASMALVALAVGWSLGVDAFQLQAAYQTDYWYGTTGTVEAADWVSAHVAPDAIYVAAKEVAIRTDAQRYVDQDNIVFAVSTGRGFDGTWAGQPLQAVVSWQREPYVADLFNTAMPSAGFREAARFGDYVVYVPALGS